MPDQIEPAAPPDVVAIFGPTGIGKTNIAIELAGLLRERDENPVAVSVDSMQVYRELPVITGAPTSNEQALLEHRLVGNVSATDNYDVATHAANAHREIDLLRAQGRRPIVVGGTGLYLRAALTELDLAPRVPAQLRERLSAELDRDGVEAMHDRLAAIDPVAAQPIERTDRRRTIRALELIEAGHGAVKRDVNLLWTEETRVPTRLFALTMERESLYAQIEQRVDEMTVTGARDEILAVRDLAGRTARQALGFEQFASGDIEALKTATRRYAKRQLTWLNKLAGAVRIDVTGRTAADVAAEIATGLTG